MEEEQRNGAMTSEVHSEGRVEAWINKLNLFLLTKNQNIVLFCSFFFMSHKNNKKRNADG